MTSISLFNKYRGLRRGFHEFKAKTLRVVLFDGALHAGATTLQKNHLSEKSTSCFNVSLQATEVKCAWVMGDPSTEPTGRTPIHRSVGIEWTSPDTYWTDPVICVIIHADMQIFVCVYVCLIMLTVFPLGPALLRMEARIFVPFRRATFKDNVYI